MHQIQSINCNSINVHAWIYIVILIFFLLHKLGCGVIKVVLFYNEFLGFYTLLIVDLLWKVVLLMIYRTGLTRVVIINVHVHSQKTQN